MNRESTHPFPLNPDDDPFPRSSEFWKRPNRNLDRRSIAQYALSLNGYTLAAAKGLDLLPFANGKREEFLQTGEWHGSFEELRYCLFAEQRRNRWLEAGLGDPGTDLVFFTLHQAVCDAWEREQGLPPDLSSRYRKELQHAIAAAQSAGEIARRYFHEGKAQQADHPIEEQIHKILFRFFSAYGFRGEELGLVSSPQDADRHLWLVDPQDGTSAADKGFRGAAVSLALLRNGQPVLGVVYAYTAPDSAGDLFFWAEGMRSVHRNNERTSRHWPTQPHAGCTALISQDADKAAEANARFLSPLRYRCVPGIAYRLALVAVGEGDLALSLNGPTGWDIAGGHALLLGAGADVFGETGKAVRYDETGVPQLDLSICYGGTPELVKPYLGREWQQVLRKAPAKSAAQSLCFLLPGHVIEDPGLLSRAQGCLLGQLAGDALGALVEFETPEQIQRQYPDGPSLLEDGGCWSTIAGQPTDDSELALALARSIVKVGTYDQEEAAAAYAQWLESGPFDYGTTTATALAPAASAWRTHQSVAQAARKAANMESQANGALMRISPLAIFGAGQESSVLMEWARQDAQLTHPHKICQEANALFAATVAFAIRSGVKAEQLYQQALAFAEQTPCSEPIRERLRAASRSLPPEMAGGKMGWVLIAFQNAFFQLLHARSFAEGLVETVRQGGDTDTNAAITGALLGAVYGREQVPPQWRDRLLACRPIQGLEDVKKPRPAQYWPVDALSLAETLLYLGRRSAKVDS